MYCSTIFCKDVYDPCGSTGGSSSITICTLALQYTLSLTHLFNPYYLDYGYAYQTNGHVLIEFLIIIRVRVERELQGDYSCCKLSKYTIRTHNIMSKL
jgi:hypothetical protein